MFDRKLGVEVQPPRVASVSRPSEWDCTRLQNLLAAARWQDADVETRHLMVRAIDLPEEAYFTEREFLQFPDRELSILDLLWRHHSGDRFGFSIQNQIWRQIGGWHREANYDTWLQFGRQVGWLRGCWLSPAELTFDLNAPAGHLPAAWTEEFELGEIALSLWARMETFVFNETIDCGDRSD